MFLMSGSTKGGDTAFSPPSLNVQGSCLPLCTSVRDLHLTEKDHWQRGRIVRKAGSWNCASGLCSMQAQTLGAGKEGNCTPDGSSVNLSSVNLLGGGWGVIRGFQDYVAFS